MTNDAQVKKISSAVSGNIVTWSGTDGATVADSGVKVQASSTAMDGASDTQVPTSKNIKTNVTKTAVLTDYTKSTTAKQALTTTDTVNSAFGKIEKRVSDNENNISKLVYETLTIDLGSATFSRSAGGIYYAGPYTLNTVGIVLGYVNTNLSGYSESWNVFLQSGSSGIYVFANTGTFTTGATATFRVFGLSSALS